MARRAKLGAGTHGLRLLVAEDDPAVAEALSELLTLMGFEPLLARDGWQALQAAAYHRFDMLVTDLEMPRIGGAELVFRLRAARPDLPVIVVSGSLPTDPEGLFGPTTGPTALLGKPLVPALLLEAIQRVLGLEVESRQRLAQGALTEGDESG